MHLQLDDLPTRARSTSDHRRTRSANAEGARSLMHSECVCMCRGKSDLVELVVSSADRVEQLLRDGDDFGLCTRGLHLFQLSTANCPPYFYTPTHPPRTHNLAQTMAFNANPFVQPGQSWNPSPAPSSSYGQSTFSTVNVKVLDEFKLQPPVRCALMHEHAPPQTSLHDMVRSQSRPR